MVTRSSRYYNAPFKGFWGFTQGDPLYPKLFNIVVESVVRQWLNISAEEETGLEGLDRAMQWVSASLYADDRLIAPTQLEWPQWQSSVLIGLVEWVRLKKNVKTIVSMVCQTFHIPGRHSEATYT